MRGAAPLARGDAHPLAARGASSTGAKLTNRAPKKAGPAVEAANHGRDVFTRRGCGGHVRRRREPRAPSSAAPRGWGPAASAGLEPGAPQSSPAVASCGLGPCPRQCGGAGVRGVLRIENRITKSLRLEKTAEIIKSEL